MKKESYIYSHTRLDNGEVFYIGIGTGRNYYRSREKERRNTHWNRVVDKHGYKIDILFDKLTFDEAAKKEIELIAFYGRVNLNTGTLVNQTSGGDGTYGIVVSEETREKLRITSSNIKRGEEEKLKKSISGKISWIKRREEGKTVSCNRKIICINTNKEYISIRQAANELKLSAGNICMVINGIRKHSKGLNFKYAV